MWHSTIFYNVMISNMTAWIKPLTQNIVLQGSVTSMTLTYFPRSSLYDIIIGLGSCHMCARSYKIICSFHGSISSYCDLNLLQGHDNMDQYGPWQFWWKLIIEMVLLHNRDLEVMVKDASWLVSCRCKVSCWWLPICSRIYSFHGPVYMALFVVTSNYLSKVMVEFSQDGSWWVAYACKANVINVKLFIYWLHAGNNTVTIL